MRFLILGGLAAAVTSCSGLTVPDWYDAVRTRAHVETLAGGIGRRPHGSEAAAEARDYIVNELRSMGFAVRVQVAEAVAPDLGLNTRVANVIALRSGAEREAAALVSHYDSVPEASGAVDDALGVAVSLEAARELVRTPLRRSLYVIVTDAEEVGLMGARAAIDDVDVRENVRAFLNFDGTGASGPGLLFQAGPGFGAPLRAWADSAWRPDGGSFSIEVYRRLPNDTDFTIFAETGASGLNFAPVGDSYAYHTDRDVVSRVQDATLRQETVNAVQVIRALDARPVESAPEGATYFGTFGRVGVAYGETTATVINLVACVVGLLAWTRLVARLWRRRGGLAVAVTWFTAVLIAVLGGAALVGVAWVLRATRAELHPWYAEPHWLFVASACAAIATGCGVAWIAARLSDRLRPIDGPAAIWCVTLPVWIALAIGLRRYAPSASYLVEWPLIAASIAALTSTSGGAGGARVLSLGSSIAAVLAAVSFWLVDSWRLLAFMVPLFGWLPVVTPVWLYAAVIGLAMLMIAPATAAALVRGGAPAPPHRHQPRFAWAMCGAAALAGALAWASPAYTEDRPHRRVARFVQDDIAGRAWWEVGGYERGVDLGEGAGRPDRWESASTALPSATRVEPIAKPFRFRADATPIPSEWPARVSATVREDGDRAVYELTVEPMSLTGLRVSLPGAAPPLASSLVGVSRGERWMASYAAVQAEGLNVAIAVPAVDRGRLDGIVLTLLSPDPPGAGPDAAWPSWLSSETTTWTRRAIRIVRGR